MSLDLKQKLVFLSVLSQRRQTNQFVWLVDKVERANTTKKNRKMNDVLRKKDESAMQKDVKHLL